MKEKFTPGPWIRSSFGTQVLTGDSWNTICVLKGAAMWKDKEVKEDYEWEIQEANARLIAAAPEMYGLLKDILNQGYSATTKPIQDRIQSLLNSIMP